MKKITMKLKKKSKIYNPKFKEECGVFGISNIKDSSTLTALGLHALQHRGQEGCGIVSFDGLQYYSEKRWGPIFFLNNIVDHQKIQFHILLVLYVVVHANLKQLK